MSEFVGGRQIGFSLNPISPAPRAMTPWYLFGHLSVHEQHSSAPNHQVRPCGLLASAMERLPLFFYSESKHTWRTLELTLQELYLPSCRLYVLDSTSATRTYGVDDHPNFPLQRPSPSGACGRQEATWRHRYVSCFFGPTQTCWLITVQTDRQDRQDRQARHVGEAHRQWYKILASAPIDMPTYLRGAAGSGKFEAKRAARTARSVHSSRLPTSVVGGLSSLTR